MILYALLDLLYVFIYLFCYIMFNVLTYMLYEGNFIEGLSRYASIIKIFL